MGEKFSRLFCGLQTRDAGLIVIFVFSAFAFDGNRSPSGVFRHSAALFLASAPKIGEKGRFCAAHAGRPKSL
jgi:hypothetical protein